MYLYHSFKINFMQPVHWYYFESLEMNTFSHQIKNEQFMTNEHEIPFLLNLMKTQQYMSCFLHSMITSYILQTLLSS